MKFPLIPVTILTLLILAFILHTPFGWITKIEVDFWGNEDQNFADIESQFNITNESSVLYLDNGDAPYFFGVNSSCRYICPLPVQRSEPSWNLERLPAYQETYGCMMNYTGNYIVSDDWWMNWQYHPEFKKKLDTEYTLVYNKSWDIYKRNQ